MNSMIRDLMAALSIRTLYDVYLAIFLFI